MVMNILTAIIFILSLINIVTSIAIFFLKLQMHWQFIICHFHRDKRKKLTTKLNSFVFHFLSRPFDINTPETWYYKFISLLLLMSLCLLCCHSSLVRGGSGVFRESQLVCCIRRIPPGLSYCFYTVFIRTWQKKNVDICLHKAKIDMRFCSDTVIIVCSCSEKASNSHEF